MKPKPPIVFFDNERVQRVTMVSGQRAACVERIRERGEAVYWLLLTSLPVTTLAQAQQIVQCIPIAG